MEVTTNSFDPFKEVLGPLECVFFFLPIFIPVGFHLDFAFLSTIGFHLKACGERSDRTLWTLRGMY